MDAQNKPQTPPINLPEWAIHISQVYAWGEQPRPLGGRITKRTIQWYSSSGLIPSPQRFGKEAYYDKNKIFCYLRIIEILNKKFNLLLSQIRKVLWAAKNLATDESGDIVLGCNDAGDFETINPIIGLSDLLEEYLEYEQNELSQCDSFTGAPELTKEQENRLQTIQREIVQKLLAGGNDMEALICGGLIGLEEKLFPKGKGEI